VQWPSLFWRWLLTLNGWEPASASSPSYTPGPNGSSTARMLTAWCQPEGYLSTDKDGSPVRNEKFFLPVKPLGCLFRGKFLAYLKEAFLAGRLEFYGQLRECAHPVRFSDLLDVLKEKEWVVYAKPPFGGPQQVLRYLARYTHRIAISNGRLIKLENGHVYFQWRDSQDNNSIKEMSLDAVEFIRRFLLHVLPSGLCEDPALRFPLQPQSEEDHPGVP